MATGSATRHRHGRAASRSTAAARVVVAAAVGIVLATGIPGAAAQDGTAAGAHRVLIGTALPSAEMLTGQSRDGWELVQIVHHAPGMRNIDPDELAMYLRQRPDGDAQHHEYHVVVGDSLPSARELVEHALNGWELVQIVHHVPGMRNIGTDQLAVYFRRPAGGP